MADLAKLIEDLLQDAAESQVRKITDGKIVSLALASQFFKDGVITLAGVSSLFEKHLKKPISEGRLVALLETGELARVCKLCTRGESLAVVPSQALATVIASKMPHGELRVTNGTDIGTYSNRHNNTNLNESDRIARVFNDELTCVVCMDILEDAVESSCCKTLCCLKCARECFAKCPICRKQGIAWMENAPIRRIVGKKPAKCPHIDCSLWSTTAEIIKHKETCEHRIVPCTNKGCNEKMKHSELKAHTTTTCKFKFTMCDVCKTLLLNDIKHEARKCICGQVLCDSTVKAHEDVCTHRLVPCQHRQCREQVQKRLLNDHMQNTCQYRLVFCPNNNCNARMFACTIANHINICPEARVNCRYCNIPCYRRNLDRHEHSVCRKRPRYQCEDCDEWYSEGDDHPETCSERFVPCPHPACNQEVKAYFLPLHEQVCPSRKVQCTNADCGKEIFAHQQRVHERDQCPHRLIICYDCYKLKPAWQMKGHRCGRDSDYDSSSSGSY